MLKFILFSKQNNDEPTPSLFDWTPAGNNKKLPAEITQPGTICLTPGLAFETTREHFVKAGYCNCGEKSEKIDLKRALKFDEKRDRDKPKIIAFNSNSIGAFKRGLSAFYKNHYSKNDPPCLIIIQEKIFEILMREGAKTRKKVKKSTFEIQDSLFQHLNIPESNPIMEKLKEVYIGDSIEVQHTRALIYRASISDSPVLILGETGTGKDVIANQIYENSGNHKSDFIRVNCSALQETLLEGEMFGYKQGSYTDAKKDKTGLFTAANGGTIFLDEIGDLSLANQAKILHAVENKEIRPIGSNKGIPVDIRIIAATNRNIDAMMQQGTFREDLYFRICSFRIKAYPLREHPDDIPILAKFYWEKKNRKSYLSPEFLAYLKTYHWPGNVRELYALLNSLVDYFGDVPPTQKYVEAIRQWRQEVLVQAKTIEKDNPGQLIKIKSQNVLIAVQNVLRSVKIELHRVFNNQPGIETETQQTGELKIFIMQQIVKLNELCLVPSNFNRWELFKTIEKYTQVLDKTVKNWPETNEQLLSIWTEKLQKPDDEINRAIMEVVWGKIDM
jgi:transcriptional regulator with AAA-type ATPase domain